MITIQKNVPLPKSRGKYGFPFEDMEVGDSFELPVSERMAATRAAYAKGKELNAKFSFRKISDERIRVWRIE